MVLLFHGAAGGWDELLIALVAFGVLWIAVKVAGRKSGNADDEDEEQEEALETRPEETDVAKPPATRLG